MWPLDPRADEIHLVDIVQALSNTCRFGGHCEFYSVAQHSVLVSERCDARDALWGLLHDASEAYLGDIPGPIKRSSIFDRYRQIEASLQRVIVGKFGLDEVEPASVRVADKRMLATEMRDLIVGGVGHVDWLRQYTPYSERVVPWSPSEARQRFLARYEQLSSGGSVLAAGRA
jgi:hypothetical protein